jgi:hypothetical protein
MKESAFRWRILALERFDLERAWILFAARASHSRPAGQPEQRGPATLSLRDFLPSLPNGMVDFYYLGFFDAAATYNSGNAIF